MTKGKLFIISGASGVGKSTVLAKVMGERPDLRFSVSATTRAPRPSEEDGVHYYFISKETFLDMIEKDAFVEYDAHNDNYYGTPTQQLEERMALGPVFLDIEPAGAAIVHKKRPDATLIFIMPPPMEELERRLRSRGDTSEEQIRIRLDRVKWETEQSVWYDHVVVNDQVETCADKILKIIAEKAD